MKYMKRNKKLSFAIASSIWGFCHIKGKKYRNFILNKYKKFKIKQTYKKKNV